MQGGMLTGIDLVADRAGDGGLGQLRVRQLAIDHVQVGPADAAGVDLDEDLLRRAGASA